MAFRNPLTVATIVTATEFELLDAAGNVVGEFVNDPPVLAPSDGGGVVMHHLDPAYLDSQLVWSVGVSTFQRVALVGPGDPADPQQSGDAPTVDMTRDDTTDVNTVRIDAGRATSGSTIDPPSVFLQATATTGVATINGVSQVEVNALNGPVLIRVGTDLFLNNRVAHVLTACDYSPATAGIALGGVAATIPGVVYGAVFLSGGDLVDITWVLDGDAGGATPAGSFAAAWLYINGVQVGPRAAIFQPPPNPGGVGTNYRWTVAQQYVYTVPASGNYTFDIRAARLGGAGGVFTAQQDSSMTVRVFASN